jgi:hypothetical protein
MIGIEMKLNIPVHISMYNVHMYYVETNHKVICLVVIGSSFDSEQVVQVSNGYL